MSRGLYGQNQGNENRTGSAVVTDHYSDNNIAEGKEVAILRRMLTENNFPAASDYMERLRQDGNSDYRIQMIYGQASAGISF